MVKKFLQLPCDEDYCIPCISGNLESSNQPRAVYGKNWADDNALLDPAVSVVQGWARSAMVRDEGGPFAPDYAKSRASTAYVRGDPHEGGGEKDWENSQEAQRHAGDTEGCEDGLEETSDERRLRRAEEKRRRLEEMQEALSNEKNAAYTRGGYGSFMSENLEYLTSKFARTSSAPPPYGSRIDPDELLSEEEAERARRINDDVFLESWFRNTSLFWTPRTHTAPKRVRRRACLAGCEACSRDEMWIRLMQERQVRNEPDSGIRNLLKCSLILATHRTAVQTNHLNVSLTRGTGITCFRTSI